MAVDKLSLKTRGLVICTLGSCWENHLSHKFSNLLISIRGKRAKSLTLRIGDEEAASSEDMSGVIHGRNSRSATRPRRGGGPTRIAAPAGSAARPTKRFKVRRTASLK